VDSQCQDSRTPCRLEPGSPRTGELGRPATVRRSAVLQEERERERDKKQNMSIILESVGTFDKFTL